MEGYSLKKKRTLEQKWTIKNLDIGEDLSVTGDIVVTTDVSIAGDLGVAGTITGTITPADSCTTNTVTSKTGEDLVLQSDGTTLATLNTDGDVVLGGQDRLDPHGGLLEIYTTNKTGDLLHEGALRISAYYLNPYVKSSNNKLYFNEGGGTLTATLSEPEPPKIYKSNNDLCTAIKTAMEAAGAKTYNVTFAGSTGKFTIATDDESTFELECNTTTNAIWTLIGFSTSADKTGAATYTSDTGITYNTGDVAAGRSGFISEFDAASGNAHLYACGPNIGHTPMYINCTGSQAGDSRIFLGAPASTVHGVLPGVDNTIDLGSGAYRWDDVYATNTTIQSSDLNLKEDLLYNALGLDFILGLSPVSYKWKSSEKIRINSEGESETYTKTYARKHHGFIAQEVKTLMDNLSVSTNEFAGYVDTGNGLGLRYTEFIAPIVRAIQELESRVSALEL